MSFLQSRSPFLRNTLAYDPPIPSVALSGTIISCSEADIVTGGSTLILTLTNDTWVPAGGTFNAQRQNIINGIDSAQSEATGWDAIVKATQGVSGVVRTSNTVVTITFDAFPTFDITSNETITVTLPSTSLTSLASMATNPSFSVLAISLARIRDIIMSNGVIAFNR